MDIEDRLLRVKELNDRLEATIAEFTDVLGQQECAEHGGNECDYTECEYRPLGAMLRTWVLCTAWEVTEEGEAHATGMADHFIPEGAMHWESVGVLTTVLDGMRGVSS